MRFVLLFAAGVVVGKNWDRIKEGVVPFAGDASARFDALYAKTAQKIGQTIEDLEDQMAERQYRSNFVRVDGTTN